MIDLAFLFARWITVACTLAWCALCIIRPTVAPATFAVVLRAARWLYAASEGYCEFMVLLHDAITRARYVTRQCYADITSGMEDER